MVRLTRVCGRCSNIVLMEMTRSIAPCGHRLKKKYRFTTLRPSPRELSSSDEDTTDGDNGSELEIETESDSESVHEPHRLVDDSEDNSSSDEEDVEDGQTTDDEEPLAPTSTQAVPTVTLSTVSAL